MIPQCLPSPLQSQTSHLNRPATRTHTCNFIILLSQRCSIWYYDSPWPWGGIWNAWFSCLKIEFFVSIVMWIQVWMQILGEQRKAPQNHTNALHCTLSVQSGTYTTRLGQVFSGRSSKSSNECRICQLNVKIRKFKHWPPAQIAWYASWMG